MCRERAIRICNNLNQTMEKIPSTYDKEYIFDPPQAKKNNLMRIYKNLIKKYKIKENELSRNREI